MCVVLSTCQNNVGLNAVTKAGDCVEQRHKNLKLPLIGFSDAKKFQTMHTNTLFAPCIKRRAKHLNFASVLSININIKMVF